MTIQTEITRISGNIAGALAAIAEKGVTVPSGSNSDDLASLIASIEAGGGGGGGGGVSTGTFTNSKYTQYISTGQSFPDGDFAFVFVAENALNRDNSVYVRYGFLMEVGGVLSGKIAGGGNKVEDAPKGTVFSVTLDRANGKVTYDGSLSNSPEYFDAGITFRWFLGGLS